MNKIDQKRHIKNGKPRGSKYCGAITVAVDNSIIRGWGHACIKGSVQGSRFPETTHPVKVVTSASSGMGLTLLKRSVVFTEGAAVGVTCRYFKYQSWVLLDLDHIGSESFFPCSPSHSESLKLQKLNHQYCFRYIKIHQPITIHRYVPISTPRPRSASGLFWRAPALHRDESTSGAPLRARCAEGQVASRRGGLTHIRRYA